jgi:glycosyltransferase involved in cell wall biosynthesis
MRPAQQSSQKPIESDNNIENNNEDVGNEEQVELKVAVGVIAYNSAQNLAKDIAPLKGIVDDIIVCDNGSYDSTASEVKALGCKIVSLPSHTDDPTATLSLFRAALDAKADVLITLLPSTRVDPADIENLAAEIVQENASIVVGTNQSIGMLNMEDSPIKAYSRDAFSKLYFAHSARLAKAKELGLKISKAQVSSRFRGAGGSRPQPQLIDLAPQSKKMTNKGGEKSARAENTSKGLYNFLFGNIWFLRMVVLVSGMVASALLLAYSVIFWNEIRTLGATMAMFPWRYYIYYTNTNAAFMLFLSGLVPSIAGLAACGFVLFKWVLPEFQISLEVFRARAGKRKVPAQAIS